MNPKFEPVLRRMIIGRRRIKLAQEKADLLYKQYEVLCEDIKHYCSTVEYLERALHRLIDDERD